MNFFKPEDFLDPKNSIVKICLDRFCDKANSKLEREGKIVYRPEDCKEVWIDNEKDRPIHRALLICIEPIEKCTHPKEKISWKWENHGQHPSIIVHYCNYCGVKVEPLTFGEKK